MWLGVGGVGVVLCVVVWLVCKVPMFHLYRELARLKTLQVYNNLETITLVGPFTENLI